MSGSLVDVNQSLGGSAIQKHLCSCESSLCSLFVAGLAKIDDLLNSSTHLRTLSNVVNTISFSDDNTLLSRLDICQSKLLKLNRKKCNTDYLSLSYRIGIVFL